MWCCCCCGRCSTIPCIAHYYIYAFRFWLQNAKLTLLNGVCFHSFSPVLALDALASVAWNLIAHTFIGDTQHIEQMKKKWIKKFVHIDIKSTGWVRDCYAKWDREKEWMCVCVRACACTNTIECGTNVSQATAAAAGSIYITHSERREQANERASRKEFCVLCCVYGRFFSEFVVCRRKHAVCCVLSISFETSRCLATSLLFINSKSAAGTVVYCVWYGSKNKNILLQYTHSIEFPYTLNHQPNNHSVCDSATSNNANFIWTLPT